MFCNNGIYKRVEFLLSLQWTPCSAFFSRRWCRDIAGGRGSPALCMMHTGSTGTLSGALPQPCVQDAQSLSSLVSMAWSNNNLFTACLTWKQEPGNPLVCNSSPIPHQQPRGSGELPLPLQAFTWLVCILCYSFGMPMPLVAVTCTLEGCSLSIDCRPPPACYPVSYSVFNKVWTPHLERSPPSLSSLVW